MALELRIFEVAFPGGRILKGVLSPINNGMCCMCCMWCMFVSCKLIVDIEVNEVDFGALLTISVT